VTSDYKQYQTIVDDFKVKENESSVVQVRIDRDKCGFFLWGMKYSIP
jgi:hypothetical protein